MEEDLQSPTARVQFSDDLSAPVPAESKRRVELTQRYDREAVQRRLDIESWMDEQLKILFNCNVSNIMITARIIDKVGNAFF
jgi:hypothetical protein